MPLEAIRDDRARACRRARSCSSTRRTPNSAGADVHPRARRVPERHRRPDVLEGVRPRRPAHRLPRRRARRARSDPPRGARLQREHRRRRRPSRPRSTIATHLHDYLRAGRTNRRRCSTPRAIGSASTYWKSARELRARPRRRSRSTRSSSGAAARGIYLRDRSTEPGCAGCLRIATGIVEHTRRVHRRDGGGSVRRAVIDRRTTETQIALTLGARRQGPVHACSTGIRFLDHMLELFARHGAFDLTIDATRRSRRRSASHGRGSRHRARRGGVEGARQPARHQPRRLLRDADGRDAGGRRDRSRRPAARRRRSAR